MATTTFKSVEEHQAKRHPVLSCERRSSMQEWTPFMHCLQLIKKSEAKLPTYVLGLGEMSFIKGSFDICHQEKKYILLPHSLNGYSFDCNCLSHFL